MARIGADCTCSGRQVLFTLQVRAFASTNSAGASAGLDWGNDSVLYQWYELGRTAVRPARMAARACRFFFNPFNPWTHTAVGRNAVAACEVFERATRRYRKPQFGITHTLVDRTAVGVTEEVAWRHPFCRLLHFKRDIDPQRAARDPRILLVAPMSGHFATLLRGTVETFLPDHDVYI